MWLTRLALRNPVLILLTSLMALALGAVSLDRLAVDLFPDISIPLIRVATFYTGAGPVDIEKSITVPIERAVSASPGVDRVESVSKQGVSLVSVWFQFGTNLDNAQFDVSQRISQILNTLPPGIQQPFNIKFDITNIPVVQVAVGSSELDEKQLYDLAYNVVEPQLERIPGVASATVGGRQVPPVRVGDVARIEDGTQDQSEIVRINGQRGVYLRVLKQPGANTIKVVDSIRAALPNLRGVPANVKLQISFDQSSYIRAAVKALEHEAVQGGLLAILVILIFLVSFRATAIVAVAIPLSIIATFVLLFFTG